MSTISDAITKDHRELEQYYNEVTKSSDHDHQERFGNQFTWELARHSVAEELIVYPAFEHYMGDKGHQMAETDRKDHHRVSSGHHLIMRIDNANTMPSVGQGIAQAVPEHEATAG